MSQVTEYKFKMGKGPYRFVGIWSAPSKTLLEANPHAYNMAMAGRPDCCHFQCDHCGMPMDHHHIVRDASGARFSVGSECIRSLHDARVLEASKAAELARKREIAKVKREAKREAQRIATEAEFEAERERNGGLTDWELKDQERKDAAADIADVRAEKLEPLAAGVAGSDFGADVVRSLVNGRGVSPRALQILAEIVAKQTGRKGSKAYVAALPEAEKLVNDIVESL